MSRMTLSVNGNPHEIDVDPDTPLLWVLRDSLAMTGTRFGCGLGQCGSCTVHVDGEATRSCITAVSTVATKKIVTIEGLSPDGTHPLQRAWREQNVAQCGYCQAGQIMAAAALLKQKPHPTEGDIATAIDNLCRCGTYNRIKSAILQASKEA